eukprot:scaffold98961_cov22-Prasinocladus_malaysianus.AAC.1
MLLPPGRPKLGLAQPDRHRRGKKPCMGMTSIHSPTRCSWHRAVRIVDRTVCRKKSYRYSFEVRVRYS